MSIVFIAMYQEVLLMTKINECEHQNGLEKIGNMKESSIEGEYLIPYFCLECNYFIYEVYDYQGMEIIE